MTVLALFVCAAAATSSSVGLMFTTVGLDENEAKTAYVGVETALRERGAQIIAVDLPATECLDRAECVAGLLQTAHADVGLSLSLLRVGAKVRVNARVVRLDGSVDELPPFSLRADELRGGAAVLDAEAHARLLQALPAPPAETATIERPPAVPERAVVESPLPSPAAPPPPPPPPAPATPTSDVLWYSGVGTAALGGLVALGASALVVEEAIAVYSPDSSGDAKERAAWLGPTAVVVALSGIAVAATGIALIAVGLVDE